MGINIRPCPFCGGKGEPSEGSFGPVNEKPVMEFHDVTCEDCFAIVPASSPKEAVIAWNARRTDGACTAEVLNEKLKGRIAELETENNELRCALFDHCENQCEGDARDACYSCQIWIKKKELI